MLAVSGTGYRLGQWIQDSRPGQIQAQQRAVTKPEQRETACDSNLTRGQAHILCTISTTYVFSTEDAFSTNQQAARYHQLSNQEMHRFLVLFLG